MAEAVKAAAQSAAEKSAAAQSAAEKEAAEKSATEMLEREYRDPISQDLIQHFRTDRKMTDEEILSFMESFV